MHYICPVFQIRKTEARTVPFTWTFSDSHINRRTVGLLQRPIAPLALAPVFLHILHNLVCFGSHRYHSLSWTIIFGLSTIPFSHWHTSMPQDFSSYRKDARAFGHCIQTSNNFLIPFLLFKEEFLDEWFLVLVSRFTPAILYYFLKSCPSQNGPSQNQQW